MAAALELSEKVWKELVQGVPEVITSLKYFQEKAPEFHVIAAGLLLGISLGRDSSFPVGKVNFLTIYPLSFSEYLLAIGEELLLDTLIHHHVSESLVEALHLKLLDHLKAYLYLGVMLKLILLLRQKIELYPLK